MASRPRNSRKEPQVNHPVPLPRRRLGSSSASGSTAEESTDDARAERVAELRRAWLEGRLDLSVSEDSPGLERLLDALLER